MKQVKINKYILVSSNKENESIFKNNIKKLKKVNIWQNERKTKKLTYFGRIRVKNCKRKTRKEKKDAEKGRKNNY